MRYSEANQNSLMEKLNEVNSKSFEERTNYIIEDLIINSTTTVFKMSTDENILNVRKFTKIAYLTSGRITGYALRVPYIENLACLTVNIKNKENLSNEELKKASDELFELISKFNFSHVVKTDSGGADIYCNVNNFDMKKEVCMNFVKNPNHKYDFNFHGHDKNIAKHSNAYVLLYGSRVKCDNSDEILKCELVIGDSKKAVEPSLSYVLRCFGIELPTKQNKIVRIPPYNKSIMTAHRENLNKHNVRLTKELLDVILLGFTVENFGKPGVIHAHAAGSIKVKPGNVSLVAAIKSIEFMNADLEPNEQFDINDILQYFCNSEVLTPKARRCLVTDYEKYKVNEQNLRYVDWMILVCILKHHAKYYYTNYLKNFLY